MKTTLAQGVFRSLQPGSARGHPSQTKKLQPGSARGHPLADKEPSAREREGVPRKKEQREAVPLAIELPAIDQILCQLSNVAPRGTAESRQCATAQSRRAFTVPSIGGS